MQKKDSSTDSRKELIEVLKSEYQKEFDTARNTDSKASNMLATAGTVTGLLFGFGTFLVSNIKPDFELISYAMFFLLLAIVSNIISVILSVFAFRMLRYQYVISLNYFLTDSGYDMKTRKSAENYDEGEIDRFLTDIAAMENSLIKSYITCNKLNALINDKKGNRVLWAQMIFLIGLLIVPLLVVVVLQAYLTGAVIVK